jgi:hypothetical protein
MKAVALALAAFAALLTVLFLIPQLRCDARSPHGPAIGGTILIAGCR